LGRGLAARGGLRTGSSSRGFERHGVPRPDRRAVSLGGSRRLGFLSDLLERLGGRSLDGAEDLSSRGTEDPPFHLVAGRTIPIAAPTPWPQPRRLAGSRPSGAAPVGRRSPLHRRPDPGSRRPRRRRPTRDAAGLAARGGGDRTLDEQIAGNVSRLGAGGAALDRATGGSRRQAVPDVVVGVHECRLRRRDGRQPLPHVLEGGVNRADALQVGPALGLLPTPSLQAAEPSQLEIATAPPRDIGPPPLLAAA